MSVFCISSFLLFSMFYSKTKFTARCSAQSFTIYKKFISYIPFFFSKLDKNSSSWIVDAMNRVFLIHCEFLFLFFSLKILFVVCLSLIIESGNSCERGGDNDCSTRVTNERISVFFELVIKRSVEDGWCSSIKSFGTVDTCSLDESEWWCLWLYA